MTFIRKTQITTALVSAIANHTYVHLFQAYHSGMVFPRYIWITYSRDYIAVMDGEVGGGGCTRQELAESLRGVFAITPTTVMADESPLVAAQKVRPLALSLCHNVCR